MEDDRDAKKILFGYDGRNEILEEDRISKIKHEIKQVIPIPFLASEL